MKKFLKAFEPSSPMFRSFSSISYRGSLLLLLIACPLLLWGQEPESDEQLAAHYFQKGQYEKAELYYKKLVDEEPGNETYFKQYVRTLLKLEKYETAQETLEERIDRKGDRTPFLHIELGKVHRAAGNDRKMKKAYERAIEQMPSDRQGIKEIAKAFIERDEAEYALETYNEGKKRIRGGYGFNFERARAYGMMGQKEKMIETYLDLLEKNRAYLQSVQNGLDRALDLKARKGDVEILREELLKRVQKNPDQEVYAEMLIWHYVQSGDLEAAYRQAKALDRRKDGSGKRLMQLGRMAQNKEEWRTAKDCYQYVVDQGSSGSHYLKARMELLEVMKRMVTEGDPTREELLDLESNYRKAIEELGRSSRTAMILKDLAHIKGFYLDEPDSAIAILRSTIELGGLSEQTVAKCKIELGDQLLLKGKVWEASLYYSQVEKSFKHSPLGHRAKFKNAKISFYTGDFEWAQAQLDVLKASTSKLIANDAMDLSMLISNNFDLDTVTEPMEMFSRAHLSIFRKDHERALNTLDSLEEAYPDHSLIDEIAFQRYRIAKERGDYKKAAEELRRIIDEHSDGILIDNALIRLAELNEERFDDPERAKELYRRLINEHQESLYVVQARKRFRELRGEGGAAPPK